MEFNFGDLRGSNECTFHRQHSIELNISKAEHIKKAQIEKKIIKDALDGIIGLNDIEDAVKKELLDSSLYRSKEQARLKTADTIAEVTRCVKSAINYGVVMGQNYLINTSPVAKDITVFCNGEKMTAKNVRPDLVITYGSNVTAVMLKTGKPCDSDGKRLASSDATNDKMLYFLMKYAEKYADDGGITASNSGHALACSGTYWFLRKITDKRSLSVNEKTGATTEVHFDENLFWDDKMNVTDNILGVTENYIPGNVTKNDINMEPILEKFRDGYDKEECTKAQCDGCSYNAICHYEHAPQVLPTEEKEVDLSLVTLSPEQERIKEFNLGYAVVNAGPGAGKTFILCFNVVNLLLSGVKPEEILIIAFSHSAAQVFGSRIATYNDDIGTGEDISGMRCVTFNEFGNEILQKEYQRFGFSKPPRVIQQVERFGIIERILSTHDKIPDLDYRNFEINTKNCKGPLAVASMAFEKIKMHNFSEFDGEAIANAVGRRWCTPEAGAALAKLYSEYDAYLKDMGLAEFADQEMLLLKLLEEDPFYFDQFGFKHILVDEAQDTSGNQFEILRYLTTSPTFESIMLVGDDSQSIYRFRDADPEGFMRFEERMNLPKGSVQQFYMMDNFRSTPEIVDFANEIISKNYIRVDKTVAAKKASGVPVTVKGFYTKDEEYDYIVAGIKEKIDSGMAPEDIAFIASSRTELLSMAGRLSLEEIPCVLLNPERLQENSRVIAGLALARYFQDPSDTQDILICLNAIYEGELFSRLSDDEIQQAVANYQAEAAQIRQLPEKEQRDEFFRILGTFDEDDEIFEGFVESLQNQPSLSMVFQYCNDFSLYGEREEKRREMSYPGVVLTTAHSSKGMEWKVVFNSLTKYDEKNIHTEKNYRNTNDTEERRRLLFVSATRAKDELYVTGLYVAFGGRVDTHFNIFLEEAFNTVGEDWDTDLIRRRMADLAKERNEKRKAQKKAEQDRILEKAAEALRRNSLSANMQQTDNAVAV